MAVFLFGVDYAGIGSHLLLKACSDRQRIVGKVFICNLGWFINKCCILMAGQAVSIPLYCMVEEVKVHYSIRFRTYFQRCGMAMYQMV